MGCCCSEEDIYITHPHLYNYKELFNALRLTPKEVKKLYNAYRKIDVDDSDSIDVEEFFLKMDLEPSRFTDRVFKTFDDDGSDDINFGEFVIGMWNYLTSGEYTIRHYTALYDITLHYTTLHCSNKHTAPPPLYIIPPYTAMATRLQSFWRMLKWRTIFLAKMHEKSMYKYRFYRAWKIFYKAEKMRKVL